MLPNDWQAICLFSPSYHIVDKKIGDHQHAVYSECKLFVTSDRLSIM